ncbi:pyridoxamine 5'-phosphate oxidase family protein [Ruegeria sp. HKCCC1038]|uniref:pyridoxamine 5'-phosphate oxidase family protein n=1 Tax=Ruegeria sp. HKCCC1038 TaxID=2682982 RepID=UPI001489BDA9|nr:pyridoxamine 5'-phosphate oxidase family protein [Ruegeria sp. HKCCC1038]
MLKSSDTNPFHTGELKAQKRAGVGDVAKWAAGFIRDYMPQQHRDFFEQLPFFVIAGGDQNGRTWVTLIDGPENFIRSPDPHRITLATELDETDPLASSFAQGTNIGVVGIELATRRRNRFSGYVQRSKEGYTIDIHQSFGNCPQYIHERVWERVEKTTPPVAAHSTALSDAQVNLIGRSDTMFIGSGYMAGEDAPSRGYDASHRGGIAGFVHVIDGTHLQIPDYPGNNFFNTIGNLTNDPHIGLVFVDFDTGGLLHISGRATIGWDGRNAHDPDALRTIDVEIDAVLDRPAALSLRWGKQDHLSRRLKLVKRVKETDQITSFYLAPVDGRPLDSFEAGQNLPIEVQIPGQKGTSTRNYSLSGPSTVRDFYRLSIKREEMGLVSRFLHDATAEGAYLEAHKPSGDFVIPCSNCPLVLVSAGVGLTPMLSMLYASAGDTRPVWYVHGTRNKQSHALRDEVDALEAQHDNVLRQVHYSRPGPDDVLGSDYDVEGRVTAEGLIGLNTGPDAHYMLCGPAAFLADIRNGLEALGVAPEHIHFETFGPGS